MKKLCNQRRAILCGLFAVLMVVGSVWKVEAASFSMHASTGTVSPGATFQVTITGNDCIGRVDLSVSNGTLSASSVWIEDDSASVTVTAGSSGTVQVTASPVVGFSDGNGELYSPGSRTVSVNIVQPQRPSGGGSSRPSTPSTTTPAQEPQEDPRSKNYDLSSLSVDQGTLTPEFSSDVTEYRVHLPKDATSITVSAKAEDAAATVIGTGKKELQAGDNTIEITCRSEYGTEQVYTIHVYVDEDPLVYLDHDGKSLGVVRNTQDVTIPDGFKESKTTIDDTQITVWTNENMHATIVYLIDEEDQKGFYLLEDGKVTSSFVPVSIAGRTLYQIDVPSDQRSFAGMQFQTVTIKDLELSGWVFDDPDLENFCVIYVMNEKGERAYYQYDSAEETLQRFNGMSIDADAYASVQNMQYVGFGIAGACAIGAIVLGVWMALRVRKPRDKAK